MFTGPPIRVRIAYDDQGLFSALLVGAVTLFLTVPLTVFLHMSPVLWIKRLYRPNHTAVPSSGPPVSASPPAHAASDAETGATRSTQMGTHEGESPHTLGFSLPYRATLISFPGLSDWMNVEESVPHLAGALDVPTPATQSRRRTRDDKSQVSTTPFSRRSRQEDPLPSVRLESGSKLPVAMTATEHVKEVPRTPLDPQVALYIYTLKYFASFLMLGSLFTIWITVLASTDNFGEHYVLRRDVYNCASNMRNRTACLDLKPHCDFVELTQECEVVLIPGLSDMTLQNISPNSWRWWLVTFFNCIFGLVFSVVTVCFVNHVDVYVKKVMHMQMQHALGYRVSAVRGVPKDDALRSAEAFSRAYLDESAYFPARSPQQGDDPARAETTNDPSAEDDDDYVYNRMDCAWPACIFSSLGFNYYLTRRRNLAFTKGNKVEAILFTREPPKGVYRQIPRTEKAAAKLQEAIAKEKELHVDATESTACNTALTAASVMMMDQYSDPGTDERRSVVTSVAVAGGSAEGALMLGNVRSEGTHKLMMRKSIPYCCTSIPAVPFYENRFRRRAERLNHLLMEVPTQSSTGAVFVVFKDALCAFEFTNVVQARCGGCFSNLTATIAGPPARILQRNLWINKATRILRSLYLSAVFIVLLFTWSIPVGILGSLDSIAYIPWMGKDLQKLFDMWISGWIRGVITAYLPVIVLAIFNMVLPLLLRRMVMAMGAFNQAERDGGHMYLQYLFMVLTGVVFQAALQGGFSQLADLIASPSNDAVIEFFIACVSPQGGYWYAKVVTSITLSAWMQMLDPVALVKALFMRYRAPVQRKYDALFAPCKMDLAGCYSGDLALLAMGLLFHMTAPLLQLFVAVYFVVRYFTQRARLYDRYRPSIPPMQDCTDFSVTVQVTRSVAWQYCLAEFGGLLLLALRDHSGGVVLASLSLANSIAILVYIHIVSRRWVPSLGFARSMNISDGGLSSIAGEADGLSINGLSSQARATDSRTVREEGESTTRRLADAQVCCNDDRNPFLSSLLPCHQHSTTLYQPLHQQLTLIDVEKEVQAMKQAPFAVKRYWNSKE